MFSRRDLVLALANRDGGAHVDNLQTKLARLANEGSAGWSIGSESNDNQPHGGENSGKAELITITPLLASVRTIASEVVLVLSNQQDVIAAAHGGGAAASP